MARAGNQSKNPSFCVGFNLTPLRPRIGRDHGIKLIQGALPNREEGHPFGLSYPGRAVSSCLSVPSL